MDKGDTMPKEVIKGTSTPFNVEVRWGPDTGIHVGVEGEEESVTVGGYQCRGVWTDIDRKGCNDLIRTLRRARDSAYGKDE